MNRDGHSLVLGNLHIMFYRTCRVPRAQGLVNALPAGVGHFPLFRVADFPNAPEHWTQDGYFIPMYPQEAMWIGFAVRGGPVALLVSAGMVNAVSGMRFEPVLSQDPQNYLAVPPQPWLDGFKRTQGESVYQFVAAELGSGETAEEQILGSAEFGGLQFSLYTPKVEIKSIERPREHVLYAVATSEAVRTRGGVLSRDMGLGAGGAISQKIYPDPYLEGRGVREVWGDQADFHAVMHIVHSMDFEAITGSVPPATPITYEFYQQNGYPWFALPDGRWGDVEGNEIFDTIKPVSGGPTEVIPSTPKPVVVPAENK
ncbi:MAG: hypothetical protein U1A25_00665 [Candidatus Sungbacteria bacterium]|nr:hypothetical protein [bacterium]MDZ4260156.1 hypothetical protein [Candidatus Sungbacteria bacterium]